MSEPALHTIKAVVCSLCLSGAGGECHVPGCLLWINRAPDLSLLDNPCLLEIDGEIGPAYRSEAGGKPHEFTGDGADCELCGEGRCYYLHTDRDDA